MTNLLTILGSYMALDAFFSLAVFFLFKYNTKLRSRATYIVKSYLGIYSLGDELNNTQNHLTTTQDRLDQEIKNRKILKTRVGKYTGRFGSNRVSSLRSRF